MIHMEIDCHSPSFTARRTPKKRARSPGSPNDRPNKRLSLAFDRFRLVQSSGNLTPQSPASSRFPSEDWVQQTDGLTIDSPVIVNSPGVTLDRDEDMNLDSEETIPVEPPIHQRQRPTLPPIQTTQVNFTHTSLFRQHHHQHTPTSDISCFPTPLGPLVTVLPPTPSIPTTSAPYIDASAMQIQTPAQTSTLTHTQLLTPLDNATCDSAMVLSSPIGSFSAPTPRKQRFTMGPRADCIKCQMNVKGHSVHY